MQSRSIEMPLFTASPIPILVREALVARSLYLRCTAVGRHALSGPNRTRRKSVTLTGRECCKDHPSTLTLNLDSKIEFERWCNN